LRRQRKQKYARIRPIIIHQILGKKGQWMIKKGGFTNKRFQILSSYDSESLGAILRQSEMHNSEDKGWGGPLQKECHCDWYIFSGFLRNQLREESIKRNRKRR